MPRALPRHQNSPGHRWALDTLCARHCHPQRSPALLLQWHFLPAPHRWAKFDTEIPHRAEISDTLAKRRSCPRVGIRRQVQKNASGARYKSQNSIVALYSKYPRALTFENLQQSVHGRAAGCGWGGVAAHARQADAPARHYAGTKQNVLKSQRPSMHAA